MSTLPLQERGFPDDGAGNPMRERIQDLDLAPVIGQLASLRRAVRPQSYYRAVAELSDVPKWHRIRSKLAEYSQRNDGFFFMQIGANDGVEYDPIRKHVLSLDWQGVLVEPVPHLFKRLRNNYSGHSGLDFANVAVTDYDGSATMLAAVELEDGERNPARLISSLDSGVVRKHNWMIGSVDEFVRPTEVEAVTLPSLVQRYGIDSVDGLFVDTEGHDKVILDQLDDLPIGAPQFILYEHTHLSRPERRELAANLVSSGYDITCLRKDTFAELQTN